jgi:hypothetical protein
MREITSHFAAYGKAVIAGQAGRLMAVPQG